MSSLHIHERKVSQSDDKLIIDIHNKNGLLIQAKRLQLNINEPTSGLFSFDQEEQKWRPCVITYLGDDKLHIEDNEPFEWEASLKDLLDYDQFSF